MSHSEKSDRLCRLEVQSSNQKWLLILGLFANTLAQRMDGCGRLAEGEEPGSNLLRVAHSSGGYFSRTSSFEGRPRGRPGGLKPFRTCGTDLATSALEGRTDLAA
jgi:hypothetical protein